MGYADYKKSREEIREKTIEQNKKDSQPEGGFEKDPDDWYPQRNKDGNGTAVIRLLPPRENDIPIVKWFSHNFQNPANGRWYINNSLRTFGEKTPDPLADFNKKLWNSTTDKEAPARKQASLQKRKTNYRVNIFVLDDPINPANNGTIKKWKFGKFFHDMISLALNPPKVEGSLYNEPLLDVYDLFEGANLLISTYTEKKGEDEFPNYSRSKWLQRGPMGEEALMERVYNELNSDPKWSLKQYIAEDQFKSFDDLKKRLDFVMGFDTVTGVPLESNSNASQKPKNETNTQVEAPKTEAAKVTKEGPVQTKNSSFFQSLTSDSEDDIPF